MKFKALLLAFLVGAVANIHAASRGDGSVGTFKDIGIWRSSDTSSNDTLRVIATGYICIGWVAISSPGVNSTIRFCQAQSTTAPSLPFTPFVSSVPFSGAFATSKEQIPPDRMIYVGAISTMGWAYTTTGSIPASVRMLWDYIKLP